MAEVDLLDRYPRATRDIAARAAAVPAQREVAMRFAREYFDGERGQGYGGYRYDGRWEPIAERMRDFYGLRAGDRVLDVGCAKGFLLHDLRRVVAGVRVAGLDISAYALGQAMDDVRPFLARGSADRLPFADKAFDLVVSINTVHNLERRRTASGRSARSSGSAGATVTSRWTRGSTRRSARSSSAGSSPRAPIRIRRAGAACSARPATPATTTGR